MSQPSTISLERPAPKIATITFSNPPVNLVVGETVTRLHELVAELGGDPGIQVVVFKSRVPDFFLNHFDLAAAADFPVPEGNDAVPIWTDVVLRLTKAPYITIASIRGRTRGGGNELALACDLRYASREKAMFGQPEVGGGLLPGGGGTERLPRFAGRDRALEIILSSSDYDAGLAERWGWVTRALPDTELDDFVDTMAARLASFDRTSLASAKSMINRATLPPDADLVAAYGEFARSLTLPGFLTRGRCRGAGRRERPRLRVPDGRVHRHRQPAGLTPARPAFTAARLQHRSPLPLDPNRPAGARRDQVLPPLGTTRSRQNAAPGSGNPVISVLHCASRCHRVPAWRPPRAAPSRPAATASPDHGARWRPPAAGRRQRCCLASSPHVLFFVWSCPGGFGRVRVRER